MNSPQPRSHTEPSSFNDLAGISVLLVEDVEFNIMVAEKMITNWKATVDVAENGVIAVSKARENKYDIVLMDLQMPVMDGYDASRYIRQFNQHIPIIALTASAPPDIKHRIGEFGMNAFLAKPFKQADLYNIIHLFCKTNGSKL